MDKYLNPMEIAQIAGKPLKVMRYSDLCQYAKLEDIFDNNQCVLLLFETTKNKGHWVILLKFTDRIEFFDSYAFVPDDELKFTNMNFKKKNNMDLPYLTYLMLFSKYPIEYNHYQFQSWNNKIATCGRWCGFRYKMSDYSLEEFIKLFENVPKKHLDKFIVELTKH